MSRKKLTEDDVLKALQNGAVSIKIDDVVYDVEYHDNCNSCVLREKGDEQGEFLYYDYTFDELAEANAEFYRLEKMEVEGTNEDDDDEEDCGLLVEDLNRAQLIQLKQAYLEQLHDCGEDDVVYDGEDRETSQEDIDNADEIVPDDVIFEHYKGVVFEKEDFWEE